MEKAKIQRTVRQKRHVIPNQKPPPIFFPENENKFKLLYFSEALPPRTSLPRLKAATPVPRASCLVRAERLPLAPSSARPSEAQGPSCGSRRQERGQGPGPADGHGARLRGSRQLSPTAGGRRAQGGAHASAVPSPVLMHPFRPSPEDRPLQGDPRYRQQGPECSRGRGAVLLNNEDAGEELKGETCASAGRLAQRHGPTDGGWRRPCSLV